MSGARIAIFEIDVDTQRVEAAPELLALLGHEMGATPQRLDEWLAHVPDPRAARDAALAARASMRDHVAFDLRVEPRGAVPFAVRVSARIVYGVGGEVVRAHGAVAALDDDRASLWSATGRLFDLVPAPISVVRGVDDLVIEYVNPACVTMWQRERASDLVGRRLLDAVPELDGQGEYVKLIRSVIATGTPVFLHEAEVTSIGPAGPRTHYFDLAYSPISSPEGVIDGAWVFAFDITPVVLARQEVDAANRAKDEFLATMSHELRTPLNSLIGWTSLLQSDSSDPARLAQGLAIIKRNADAQAKLVEDLLDVSRIITGKLRLSMEPTNVNVVVDAAVEVVRPAAEQRGVRIVTDLARDIPTIRADAHRLQQIVWNLASNAVRFTPRDGEVRVTMRAERGALRLEVRDTGRGIAADHLPHVFERFRQVDSSTTRTHGGLGLGLAIVRHLVEAHGGVVSAASDGLDRGAVFVVELPIGSASAMGAHASPGTSAHGPPVEAARNRAAGAEHLRGKRILVVDDDADSVELLGTTLRDAGVEVVVARGPEGALEASGAFDLVVSDIAMPGMDGYELLARLRERAPVSRPVRAIALTAYARVEDEARSRAAGFVAHLSKPYEPPELLRLVGDVLARSASLSFSPSSSREKGLPR
ncbi:MAG: response regulator [Deltaproteobacteria bacterium]|nr:response regulator [Deltaproteobacteria bacterium]